MGALLRIFSFKAMFLVKSCWILTINNDLQIFYLFIYFWKFFATFFLRNRSS